MQRNSVPPFSETNYFSENIASFKRERCAFNYFIVVVLKLYIFLTEMSGVS